MVQAAGNSRRNAGCCYVRDWGATECAWETKKAEEALLRPSAAI
jgi:hypothetical protein